MTVEDERGRVREFLRQHKVETVVGLAAAATGVTLIAGYLLWRRKREKSVENELLIAKQIARDGKDGTSVAIVAAGIFADTVKQEAVEAGNMLAGEVGDIDTSEGLRTVAQVTEKEGRQKKKRRR